MIEIDDYEYDSFKVGAGMLKHSIRNIWKYHSQEKELNNYLKDKTRHHHQNSKNKIKKIAENKNKIKNETQKKGKFVFSVELLFRINKPAEVHIAQSLAVDSVYLIPGDPFNYLEASALTKSFLEDSSYDRCSNKPYYKAFQLPLVLPLPSDKIIEKLK